MNKETLGRMVKVDLRNIWETEAKDFTPWLAQEENLVLLGDTIGLDLELEAQEVSVGAFRADILCRSTPDGSRVLIENQLELTDHKHLGQILTYATGLKAKTIIWIADKFTEEHQKTIEWLNENTVDDIYFFGLEVELWRIGNSPIAPKFNIVAKPNDWFRAVGEASRSNSTELSPTKAMQLEYWTEYVKYVSTQKTIIKPQKPSPCHWMNASIGRSNFHMYALVDTIKNRIGVRLCLSGLDAKNHFKLLEMQKKEIEADMGEPLAWDELPDKQSSYMCVYRNYDPKQKSTWGEQHKIILDMFERMHKAFAHRIKELDAEDYQPNDEKE